MFFQLIKSACDFWGLLEDKFGLYYANGNKIEIVFDSSNKKYDP